MRTKDEAFCKYKLYEAMINSQCNVYIKELITDRGGKYTSNEFETYLKEQGTKYQLTVHDTPEQNGVTEHLNCTLVKKARANYIKNHTYTRALLDKMPYEVMHQKKINLHNSQMGE